jgi:outer membrane lipopolysaccharide assembly protein LptE/RlpB
MMKVFSNPRGHHARTFSGKWVLRACGWVSLVWLGSCGFQIVKPVNLTGRLHEVVLISDNRYSDFNQELSKSLKGAGVARVLNEISMGTKAVDDNSSTIVIEIIKDATGQDVLSVSATNTPTEYEVFYTVQLKIRSGSKEILAPTEFALRREYSYAVNAALAKEHERATIRAALAHDISELVLRRLAALSW